MFDILKNGWNLFISSLRGKHLAWRGGWKNGKLESFQFENMKLESFHLKLESTDTSLKISNAVLSNPKISNFGSNFLTSFFKFRTFQLKNFILLIFSNCPLQRHVSPLRFTCTWLWYLDMWIHPCISSNGNFYCLKIIFSNLKSSNYDILKSPLDGVGDSLSRTHTYLFDICHQNSLGYIDKLVFHLWLDTFHDYNDSVPIHMDYG